MTIFFTNLKVLIISTEQIMEVIKKDSLKAFENENIEYFTENREKSKVVRKKAKWIS